MLRKGTIPRTCRHCGETFWSWPCFVEKGRAIYCRIACWRASQTAPASYPIDVLDDGAARIPLFVRDRVTSYALIDSDDAEHVRRHRWYRNFDGYAMRTIDDHVAVRMHRDILGLAKGDGTTVDHINRNRLDNRRSNLRIVTPAGNTQNRGSGRGSRSTYRGVYWEPGGRGLKPWRPRIRVDGKLRHVGCFATEKEAAEAARAARARLMPFAVD